MTVTSSGTIALFSGPSTLVTQSLSPGEVWITGSAEFDDMLSASGVGGTSLLIDAGGSGFFDPGSEVVLAANVTIGDAGGAGTLDVETLDFAAGMNLVVAGGNAASSLVEIAGGLSVNGTLSLESAALLDLGGTLGAAATAIAVGGTLSASGTAMASFGGLVDAGTLALQNGAAAVAANLILTGALRLGGQSALTGLSTAVIGGAGSLVIGQGARFGAGQLNAIGGGISIAGSLLVAGNLVTDTGVTLSGGTLSAAAATLGSGGIISGFGDVVLSNAGSKISVAGGGIVATGGLLSLDGNVTLNSGSIAIAASAALELVQGASGAVVFEGVNSELIIDDLAVDSASVSGMVGHDVIDLIGVAPSLVTYSGGLIHAAGAGVATGSFALTAATGQPAVAISADGSGGALITLGGEMACFARGTRLLTPNGYVPVEAFKPGDPIITQAGAKVPVRWIGQRVMEGGSRARTGPVVVMPGAVMPGAPSREIRLSPSHALYLDGVLVPVMHLVNGATILRERKPGTVTYYHIELDRHEVVMADGVAVETYLDTGNRGQFSHEMGKRGDATKRFAPLVTAGPKLALIRRQLHELAIRAGFTLVHDPMLRAIAHDVTIAAEMTQLRGVPVARFSLPADAGRLLLRARSATPADTDPDTDDRRELGICLRQPRAQRDRWRLGAGWYEKAAGDKGIWMGGWAEILVPPGVTQLALQLAAVSQSWQPPAVS